MPVILQPEDEEQWLDVSRTSFGKARSLLKLIQGLLERINDNFMHGIPATTIVIRKLTT
jgi:putative SOS response-associated peptidase YedK